MIVVCEMCGAFIVWNLLDETGTASTSLAYVKAICIGVESVCQNCVMGRCASLHIHILLHLPFYNWKKKIVKFGIVERGFYLTLRAEIKYMKLNSSGGVVLSHSVHNIAKKFTISIIIYKNVFK